MTKTEIKRPPRTPHAPYKPDRHSFSYFGAKERSILYRDLEVLGDNDSFDIEKVFEEEEFTKPEKSYSQVTLQDIVDAAPPGAKLSDIRLSIDYPRMMDYLDVCFVYQERNLEIEEAAFQTAMQKYDQDYAVYEKEMEKYQQDLIDFETWRRAEKVKQLEKELATLKK